jgi:serine-type D-Ala-D-Ala carboxypeptidase
MPFDFNRLRAVAGLAVQQGVTPGLVVSVGASGQTLLCEAFGARQIDPGLEPATVDTVYDLASLTKALATSLLVMQEVGRGRLALEDRLDAHLPVSAGRPSGAATVRLLLCHAAGLPAHRPFFERTLAAGAPPGPTIRDDLIEAAAAEPLVYEPGSRSLYSDVGFILLGALLEARAGEPLDRLFRERVARPCGLEGALGYARAGDPPWMAALPVAPTVRCPVRGRLLQGEVDDLNAWALGGVAGHAGLFAAAPAVTTLAHALCAAYRGSGHEPGRPALVGRDLLRTFFRPAGVPGSTWRLGWDGPAPLGSLAGARLSRAAVGHLGFTGCSFWLDPEQETFVLVLANRTHPAVREDARWKQLRPALNDSALEAIGYRPA